MSITEQIRGEMLQIAESHLDRIPALKKELHKIEVSKTQIEAELASLIVLKGRISSFEPIVAGDRQCPKCFVTKGTQAAVGTIESISDIDNWRCPDCRFEFSTDA